jgi:hypothetical protein
MEYLLRFRQMRHSKSCCRRAARIQMDFKLKAPAVSVGEKSRLPSSSVNERYGLIASVNPQRPPPKGLRPSFPL